MFCPAAAYSFGQTIFACVISFLAWPALSLLFRAFERLEDGK